MVETRSKTKADLTATEAGRVQRERHERSPRGARPGSATNDGASALPDDSSSIQQVGTSSRDGAHPGPTLDSPNARANMTTEGNVKAPIISTPSVHSEHSHSKRSHSTLSLATIRAQKLALEAEGIRRQVDRERELTRQQMEREREQEELEFELMRRQAALKRQQAEREREFARQQEEREREADQAELQAKLAALDASDKSINSRSSRCSSQHARKRTLTWVSEQNADMTNIRGHVTRPGEAPTVFQRTSQPVAPANTASLRMPVVNRTSVVTNTKPVAADFSGNYDTVVEQRPPFDQSTSNPIQQLAKAISALSHGPKKVELVPFSGDVGQWMSFKSSYERTKSNFSPSENIDRLNNAIRGPAYQSVASLFWTPGDPDDVIRTLEQTYARPELLVACEVAELRNSPKLSSIEDLNMLANKLRNFVTTLKLLKQTEYLSSPELFRCVLIKLSEHTRARFADFASVHTPEEQMVTKLELLSCFLLTEADKQLKYNFLPDATVKTPTFNHSHKFQFKKETVHATVSNNKVVDRCTYCKQGPHNIKSCKVFLNLTTDDRWRWVRETKVCYRCLKSNPHTWNNCRAKRCGVDGCSRRHNALLHGTGTAHSNASTVPSGQCNNNHVSSSNVTKPDRPNGTDSKTERTVEITNTSDCLINATGSLSSASRLRGLLKVVPIVLEGPDGEFETTALLDEGSTATLIDGEVAARIGAKSTHRERLRVEGVSGMNKEVEVSYVDFYIRGRNQHDRYLVKHARAIKPLGLRAQNPTVINFMDYDHLSDLSGELSYTDTPPTVLIGAPDWQLSLSREVRCGKKNEPVASRTLLGWVLHGALSVSSKPLDFVNHVSDDLDTLIKRQYDIDALGITKYPPRLNDDDKRAVDIIESSARQLHDGHYEVGLPWKKDLPTIIPNSYPQAMSRFKALQRQMAKDPVFAAAFQHFIDDIIRKGYAEECDPNTYYQRPQPNTSCVNADGSMRWYLPIFGVLHPQKKKLRAVHDAAAVTKGVSLNNLLLQGPDLLSPLLDILFRFREGAIALNGDIKEMFPQVKISPRDRDAQRFLWCGKDGNIKEYRMSSMIFGAVSSPFIALYIKNKNAKALESDFPAACKAIINDHYMDDFLGSYSSVAEAAQLAADVVTVHKACGFEMRAWTSNSADALSLVPKELRSDATSDVCLPPNSGVGVLGVRWNPHQDSLGFRAVPDDTPTDKLTKRTLLSKVMKVYDPLGLLMPVIIWGRILIQRLWRARVVGWDTQLPIEYIDEYKNWITHLQIAANNGIPRWYMSRSDVTDVELHVLADGGEQAYACVAYWRFTYSDGSISIALIGSKARVSPLKPISIPRLELQAAVIATRFSQTILQAHRYKPSETIFWTDSTTVLKWIRSDPRAYKPFVAHRLGEILEATNPSEWKWIPTSLNVADDATKPKKAHLISSHRWFTGPLFLTGPRCTWPTERIADEEETAPDPELKSDLVILFLDTTSSGLVPDPTRFSSWLRLLRATVLHNLPSVFPAYATAQDLENNTKMWRWR